MSDVYNPANMSDLSENEQKRQKCFEYIDPLNEEDIENKRNTDIEEWKVKNTGEAYLNTNEGILRNVLQKIDARGLSASEARPLARSLLKDEINTKKSLEIYKRFEKVFQGQKPISGRNLENILEEHLSKICELLGLFLYSQIPISKDGRTAYTFELSSTMKKAELIEKAKEYGVEVGEDDTKDVIWSKLYLVIIKKIDPTFSMPSNTNNMKPPEKKTYLKEYLKKICGRSQVGDFVISQIPLKAGDSLDVDDCIYISSKTKTQERWATDNNINVRWRHKINFGTCKGDVKKMTRHGYIAYCLNHKTENLKKMLVFIVNYATQN